MMAISFLLPLARQYGFNSSAQSLLLHLERERAREHTSEELLIVADRTGDVVDDIAKEVLYFLEHHKDE